MRTLLFIACGLLLAGPAGAADLIHAVGNDETLETIAKNYYGSAWKAVYVAARNGVGTNDKLNGRRLIIPTSWTYKVKRGDSLATVARQYLGEGERYKAVMLFNDIKDISQLSSGQTLLMPFHLVHAVQPGEAPSNISRRYYRTTRYANMLMEYNKLSALRPGQKIVVPIFDRATVDARAHKYAAGQKPPATPAAGGGTNKMSAAEARRQMQNAVAKYNLGEFDEACLELDGLFGSDEVELDGPDRITLIQHLGFCAVAHGNNAAASDYFHKWIEMDPKAALNPITTSPKILAVFHEVAGGEQKEEAD